MKSLNQNFEEKLLNFKVAQVLYNTTKTPISIWNVISISLLGISFMSAFLFIAQAFIYSSAIKLNNITNVFVGYIALASFALMIISIIFIVIDKIIRSSIRTMFINDSQMEKIFLQLKHLNLYEYFVTNKLFKTIVCPSKPIRYSDIENIYLTTLTELHSKE